MKNQQPIVENSKLTVSRETKKAINIQKSYFLRQINNVSHLIVIMVSHRCITSSVISGGTGREHPAAMIIEMMQKIFWIFLAKKLIN